MKMSYLWMKGVAAVAFSGAVAASAHSQSLELRPIAKGTFELVQTPKGHSFDTGRYNFHARARQSDGLYRGIMIYSRSKNPKIPEETIMAYARFGRRDTKVANRWVLGDVVLHTYDRFGAHASESTVKRLTLNIT